MVCRSLLPGGSVTPLQGMGDTFQTSSRHKPSFCPHSMPRKSGDYLCPNHKRIVFQRRMAGAFWRLEVGKEMLRYACVLFRFPLCYPILVFPSGDASVSRLKVRTLIREVGRDPNQLTPLSEIGRGQGFDDFRSKALRSDALLMQTSGGNTQSLSLSSENCISEEP
jgi:hypothetical protein